MYGAAGRPVVRRDISERIAESGFEIALGLYAFLAATWSVAAATLAMTDFHGHTAGFGVEGFTWRTYLLTQPGVIMHYLQLAFWPAGLCLDYNWPLAETVEQIVVPGTIVIALLGLTILGLAKRSALGFLRRCFLPDSGADIELHPEHGCRPRSADVFAAGGAAALVVIGGYAVWDRLIPCPEDEEYGVAERVIRWGLPVALVAVAAVALGWATLRRNMSIAPRKPSGRMC